MNKVIHFNEKPIFDADTEKIVEECTENLIENAFASECGIGPYIAMGYQLEGVDSDDLIGGGYLVDVDLRDKAMLVERAFVSNIVERMSNVEKDMRANGVVGAKTFVSEMAFYGDTGGNISSFLYVCAGVSLNDDGIPSGALEHVRDMSDIALYEGIAYSQRKPDFVISNMVDFNPGSGHVFGKSSLDARLQYVISSFTGVWR